MSGAFARLSALGALLLATVPAHAGLFDDDEARRAILDLRARLAQSEEQNRARQTEAAATQAQLAEQAQALRRGLLDLNNQLEQLRTELARLRGSDEQLQRELADARREVADLQRRQRDIGQAYDERIRKLEPVRVTLDGREFNADPEERKAHDDAVALLRAGEFDKAVAALGAFQRRWPGSGYADSVRYWLGNAQYARRDHAGAIATFRAFIAGAPGHPRVAEAMLALANSQAENKDGKGARATLQELIKAHPKSEAAQAARERLATLK